jgi:hypothetical protein
MSIEKRYNNESINQIEQITSIFIVKDTTQSFCFIPKTLPKYLQISKTSWLDYIKNFPKLSGGLYFEDRENYNFTP